VSFRRLPIDSYNRSPSVGSVRNRPFQPDEDRSHSPRCPSHTDPPVRGWRGDHALGSSQTRPSDPSCLGSSETYRDMAQIQCEKESLGPYKFRNVHACLPSNRIPRQDSVVNHLAQRPTRDEPEKTKNILPVCTDEKARHTCLGSACGGGFSVDFVH